jgi:hypothetical protein
MDEKEFQRLNRRVCPSELRQTIKALKRAVRKEEKRADKMLALRNQIDELAGRLVALRDADRPNRG